MQKFIFALKVQTGQRFVEKNKTSPLHAHPGKSGQPEFAKADFIHGAARKMSKAHGGEQDICALQSVIAGNRNLSALFRSTTAITMASGSAQANILPEKATLTVNCRFLEGDTVESMLEYYRSIVPEGVEVRLIKGNNLCHTSPMDEPYHILEEVTQEMYPGMLCVPGYLLGGTDSRYYTVVSDHVYRYGSFYGNDEYGPAHSVNEAIPLSVLTGGPTFFEKLLLRYGK